MKEIIQSLQIAIQEMLESLISSFPQLILGIFLFFSYLAISKLLKRILIKRLEQKLDDILLLGFLSDIIKITNVIIAILLFLYAIGKTGIITSILGAAGVSAFIIGFAFKDIGENFLAGVIMAFNRPFRLGDTIKSNNIEGVITELNLRDTLIKTFDGKDVSIPNGFIIKNPLFNYTKDGFLRHTVTFVLSNPENAQDAMSIINSNIKNVKGVLTDTKSINVYIPNMSKNSIEISANYWFDTYDTTYSSTDIKSEIYTKCVMALLDAGHSLDNELIDIRNYDTRSFQLSIDPPHKSL